MTKTEFAERIRNGEDSKVEFKRDDVANYALAKEIVAFLNLAGGTVLLGVEDDGSVSGVRRDRLEAWVAEVARTKIEPPVVPVLAWVRDAEPGRDVLAATVTTGPDKPYARVHNNRKTYYIRVGSTSREASREELGRMYQASGRLHYGLLPVPGADFDALDWRRLHEYLTRVLAADAPDLEDRHGWETLLHNLELMTDSAGERVATANGILLFGKQPSRFLPQSGVRAVCYAGDEPDYAVRADERLHGAMTPLRAASGSFVEIGLMEQAWDFVRRNTMPTARLDGPRRVDGWEFPEAVVREGLVNALVHRDYGIAGTDVMLSIYSDRLEIASPGGLPNTVTVERMKAGVRYSRNQTLVNVMRDYGYVDGRGMGVRNKIIPGMRAHNGTEPVLLAEDHRFTVRLLKAAEDRAAEQPPSAGNGSHG